MWIEFFYSGAFIFRSRGTPWTVVLETEFEKYGALSFETVLRSYCTVSDESHDYGLEVVMGRAAAQSFSFLFAGASTKIDDSQPSLCLAVPFVRFLQSHSLRDVFLNCAPSPWVLVINRDDKWKYSKINLFSLPFAKSVLITLCRFNNSRRGGRAQDFHCGTFPGVPQCCSCFGRDCVFPLGANNSHLALKETEGKKPQVPCVRSHMVMQRPATAPSWAEVLRG